MAFFGMDDAASLTSYVLVDLSTTDWFSLAAVLELPISHHDWLPPRVCASPFRCSRTTCLTLQLSVRNGRSGPFSRCHLSFS